MTLKDYHYEMSHCHRCSYCKFLPFQRIKSKRFAYNCPSIALRDFHSFSAGGRVVLGLALAEGKLEEYTEYMKQIVFECTLCGACQIACRTYNFNLNPIEVMHELRTHFVERGELVPEHMMMIEGLKREDNVFGEPKGERGNWAEGLDIKDVNRERVDVLFHAGCRISYDDEFWPLARSAIQILTKAGVDVGIAGREEACCGGRAYEMGFEGEFQNYAEDFASRLKASGASKLVTCCSDGYGTFKNAYPRIGRPLDVEILHITELIHRLMQDGRIRLTEEIPMRVTYHDPCHLGRRGEPGVLWKGEYRRIEPHIFAAVPEKPMAIGLNGCYEAPREILKALPGVEFVEMERIRELSWCCGAGAGVLEAYEELATETAMERIEEAKSTGAQALVTACPWCERNFKDTIQDKGETLEVYDVIELVDRAMGGA